MATFLSGTQTKIPSGVTISVRPLGCLTWLLRFSIFFFGILIPFPRHWLPVAGYFR